MTLSWRIFQLHKLALACHPKNRVRTLRAATSLFALTILIRTGRTLLENELKNNEIDEEVDDEDYIPSPQKIPIDFVERLAAKSYLQLPGRERPPGIPRTLRLLTVDLPAVRTRGLSENAVCEAVLDRSFAHGVAPPRTVVRRRSAAASSSVSSNNGHDNNKTVNSNSNNINKWMFWKRPKNNELSSSSTSSLTKQRTELEEEDRLQVEQKIWAQAFYQCHDSSMAPKTKKKNNNKHLSSDSTMTPSLDSSPIAAEAKAGLTAPPTIEIMEASMMPLNPNNLRRVKTIGTWHYDPGKYTGRRTDTVTTTPTTTATSSRQDIIQEQIPHSTNTAALEKIDVLLDDVEEIAPWHQQAWKEEALLRIRGQVAFGEPLQRAPKWRRWLFGETYRRTVPSSSPRHGPRYYAWLLSPWRTTRTATNDDCDDLDGSAPLGTPAHLTSWASQRPHAVLAHGAALQRVPHAYRWLQYVCQQHDVPLLIVHDPRKWGSNTHDSLGDALQHVRVFLKQHFVATSLQYAAGRPFQWGQWLGRAQVQAEWQAKAVARQVQAAAATVVVRNDDNGSGTKAAAPPSTSTSGSSWHDLDVTALQQQLEERGVMGRNPDDGQIWYSQGLMDLLRAVITSDENVSSSSSLSSTESPSGSAVGKEEGSNQES